MQVRAKSLRWEGKLAGAGDALRFIACGDAFVKLRISPIQRAFKSFTTEHTKNTEFFPLFFSVNCVISVVEFS